MIESHHAPNRGISYLEVLTFRGLGVRGLGVS